MCSNFVNQRLKRHGVELFFLGQFMQVLGKILLLILQYASYIEGKKPYILKDFIKANSMKMLKKNS